MYKIDDYCYISTKTILGKYAHIASHCTIAGGKGYTFRLGDYSSLASGVKIYCACEDYTNSIIGKLPSALNVNKKMLSGNVVFENYTGIGANSVVLPNNIIPEGTVIGALSFVPFNFQFESWSVYVGTPIKKINVRNKELIYQQIKSCEIMNDTSI